MSWFSEFGQRGRRPAVEGRVWCGRQGVETDIERCLACDRFVRAGTDAHGPWIVCRDHQLGLPSEHPILNRGH